MIDTDRLVDLYWEAGFSGPRNKKSFDTAIRQNMKVLLEATDQSSKYIVARNKLGSSFEALFRSVGLGAGVLLGGPVGAPILSSIAGGVGRGVGDYLGNRIYGKTLSDLSKIQANYKYEALMNYYGKSNADGQTKLIDEFYKQANEEDGKTIQDLAQ